MRQQCYEIQVGSDSLRLLEGNADLWNSGRVESDEMVMIAYGGKVLRSRMLCYWRVRVGNEQGEFSAWSSVQKFAIGLLNHEDFYGHYIGLAQGDVRTPLLRKSFVVENRRTAFLHVNSLGYHEVYVNGVKADTQVLSPAVSQLDKRSLIVTYDVTPLLSVGKNEIVLWLGQGWYKKGGHFSAQYEGPVVKAELSALEDGEWKTWVVTDDTWLGSESGYVDMGSWKALRFGGERIDARMLPSALSASELNKRPWGKVAVVNIRKHKVSPQMCEPNRIQETLTPKSISPLDKDTWLIDMGRVLTGWFSIRLSQLPAGHEVVASYSDYMKPDGQIEEQGEKDVYVASGRPGGDEFCNKFHYHAFRYVKLSNLPCRPAAFRRSCATQSPRDLRRFRPARERTLPRNASSAGCASRLAPTRRSSLPGLEIPHPSARPFSRRAKSPATCARTFPACACVLPELLTETLTTSARPAWALRRSTRLRA